jgi:hypothetical protein
MDRSFALRGRDDDEFGRFECWDGDPATPWIGEAQDHARVWSLTTADHALAFRDDNGVLIAITAFSRGEIEIPLLGGTEQPCWDLQVLAIALDHQRQGLSEEVFLGTFAAMLELDRSRMYVRGRVHKDHHASRRACACVEMHGAYEDPPYWVVVGDPRWRP